MIADRVRSVNERLWPGHLAFGPRDIVLGVNNFCNLHCLMCDVGTGNDETNFGANLVGAKTRSMPIELFHRIADQTARCYPDARLTFAFTEPLAWKPLAEALDYARAKNIATGVTTNGLLLPRRAGEIAAAGCGVLSVSIDGPAAVHDRIRRHEGSFERAVSGIEAVLAQPDPPEISVYCTITQWNVGVLEEFLREMGRLKLKRVGLLHNNFVTADQAGRHNLLHGEMFPATASNVFLSDPAAIDLPALSAELTRIAATDHPFPVVIQPHVTGLTELEIYYHRPEVFVGRRCHDASRILMIDSDGEAIPVHGRCFRFPIANIRDLSLREIWNHSSLAELRRTLNRAGGLLPACSRCCGGFGGAPKPDPGKSRAAAPR